MDAVELQVTPPWRSLKVPLFWLLVNGCSSSREAAVWSSPARRICVNLKRIDFKRGRGRLCRIPPAGAGGRFKYKPQTQAPKINYTSPPTREAGWGGGEIMKLGSLL
jgi:hypothetical protein